MLMDFSARARLRFLLFVHLCFVLTGATTTLLGVVLPAIAANSALTDVQSARLFVWHAAGALLGTFASEKLWARCGFVNTIVVGLLASALGVVGIELFPGWLIALAIFLNGCGVGLTIPSVNLLVAKIEIRRAAAALNLLNFSWSVGALASPVFFAALGNRLDIGVPLFALAAALFVCAILLAQQRRLEPRESGESTVASEFFALRFWTGKYQLLTLLFFFVYVGAENGLSGWLSSFAWRLEANSSALWTPVLAVFWTAFLLGRLLAPLVLRKLSGKTFLRVCAALATAGMFVLLFAPASLIVFGAALAACGLAPIFPTALAQFTNRNGDIGTPQVKWLFVGGTIGGTAATWLVGVLAGETGDLARGLTVILICCVAMLCLRFVIDD